MPNGIFEKLWRVGTKGARCTWAYEISVCMCNEGMTGDTPFSCVVLCSLPTLRRFSSGGEGVRGSISLDIGHLIFGRCSVIAELQWPVPRWWHLVLVITSLIRSFDLRWPVKLANAKWHLWETLAFWNKRSEVHMDVQDPHGKVFIVSGNRRLFALKAFADQLPKEEGAQCVKANTLLVSLSDMHLFPQSLFARCVEAFTSHDGGRPTLRAAVQPAEHPQAQSVARPAVVLKAVPSVPRGTILRSWALKGLEGFWIDHRGSVYMVEDKQGVGLEVIRNNGTDCRNYRLEWDGQTFVWPLTIQIIWQFVSTLTPSTGAVPALAGLVSYGTDSTNSEKWQRICADCRSNFDNALLFKGAMEQF